MLMWRCSGNWKWDARGEDYVFIHRSRRREVASFHPTIFKFRLNGFERVRKGEYVSREPQRAISAETIPIAEATKRWNVQACYVDDLDGLMESLNQEGVYFEEQT